MNMSNQANNSVARNNLNTVFGSGVGRIAMISFIVALVLMFSYGCYQLFFSSSQKKNSTNGNTSLSSVDTPNQPGFEVVSLEEEERRVKLHDQQADEAQKNGAGYMAKPVISQEVRENLPPLETNTQQVPVVEQLPPPELPPVQPVLLAPPQQPIDPKIEQAVAGQLESVIGAVTKMKTPFTTVYLAKAPQPVLLATSVNGADSRNGVRQSNGQLNKEENSKGELFMTAGDVCYATLDTGISSDDTLMVMATIHSCMTPNSSDLKGAKLLGYIEMAQDQIRVVFDRLNYTDRRNRGSIPISAIAVTEEEARSGIGQDVDHHYFSRYFSLAMASLLTGYGRAVMLDAQSGRTIVTPTSVLTDTRELNKDDKIGIALGEVGAQLGSEIKRDFNRPTTISSPRGMGIGVIFTNDVFTTKTTTAKAN